MCDRLEADYWIETAVPLEQAAATLAGEQSSGTFVRVEGQDSADRCAARVEGIEDLGEAERPSLPGARAGRPIRCARVTVSWPTDNFGDNLPVMFTTVSGNLYELKAFSGLRLLDVRFPDGIGRSYPGPKFGVAGTRKLCSVEVGPMVGTIVKPSVGLSPEETGSLVARLAEAGLDFVKDDELQADSPHSPFEERLRFVLEAADRNAQATGKRVMYAPNLTDEPDAMARKADLVRELGGTCVMVNLIQVGLAGVAQLARTCGLPIHGHRNMWGALSRHPGLGMDYSAFQAFFKLAGVDQLHVNGLRNKFCEPDASVIASAKAVARPAFEGQRGAVPVFSSGQWAGQAWDTYAALGHADLLYLSGGGMLGHPDGPEAGVASVRQAWGSALEGTPPEAARATYPELDRAFEAFS